MEFDFSKQEIDDSRFFNRGEDVESAINTDWLEWRHTRGLAPRFQSEFLHDIWQSFAHTPRMVFGERRLQDNAIDTVLTQSSMSPGVGSFARLIDKHIQPLHPAFYKSAMIETLYGFASFCKDHPQVKFKQDIVLGEVLDDAAEKYVNAQASENSSEREIDLFVTQSPYVFQEYIRQRLCDMAELDS